MMISNQVPVVSVVTAKTVDVNMADLLQEREGSVNKVITSQLESKSCTRCKQEKPIDQFSKRPGGYQSWCKACTCQASKDRQKTKYYTDPDYRRTILEKKAQMTVDQRVAALHARSRDKSIED